MGLGQKLGFYTTRKFSGNWPQRLEGLFDCGVDFSGKSILDVGCNIGIIAYEISKQKPRSIHGVDSYRAAIRIAKCIFGAVPVESQFQVLNLLKDKDLRRTLRPLYDIVLMLAVYHHIREADPIEARRVVLTLAERCSDTLIVRNPPRTRVNYDCDTEISEILKEAGFTLEKHGPVKNEGSIQVFQRKKLPG